MRGSAHCEAQKVAAGFDYAVRSLSEISFSTIIYHILFCLIFLLLAEPFFRLAILAAAFQLSSMFAHVALAFWCQTAFLFSKFFLLRPGFLVFLVAQCFATIFLGRLRASGFELHRSRVSHTALQSFAAPLKIAKLRSL